jgi:hypothetical protein
MNRIGSKNNVFRPSLLAALHKAFLLIVLAAALQATAIAQEDESQAPERPHIGGIVGGGGGVSPAWYFVNTRELNSALAALGYPSLPESGMFMMGGHGYAYIVIIPNLRIGGIGAGGVFEASSFADGDPWRRTSLLSASFGGVTLDYVIPFKRFHIAIGGVLGAGSYQLTLRREPTASIDWDKTTSDMAGTQQILTSNFFAWQPALALEYDLLPYLVVSGSAGWYGSSGSSWTLNDAVTVLNVPEFKFGGPFIRVCLTAGLFIGE